jgi:hypothetical protein
MSTSADASAAVPATIAVPTTGVSLPLVVNTTGVLSAAAHAAGGPPTLHSIADTLAGITTTLTSLQLQMAAVTHQLADQGARLTSLDGRPSLRQFGLPGFGGIPALAASSTPVITDVTAAAGDSFASASSSLPLSSLVPQGSQQGKKYRPVESEISEISRLPAGSEIFPLSSEIFIFLKSCHPNRRQSPSNTLTLIYV